MLIKVLESAVAILGVLGLLAGAMLLWRMRYCEGTDDNKSTAHQATVIIPARNEAQTLPGLLGSLRDQNCDVEIIVVDDHSDDGTANAARSFGARVISSQPLPSGWSGKTWACYQGAGHASHDTMIFLDADIVIAPKGLKKIIAAFEHEAAVISIAPYHITHKPHEQLSAIFNLIVVSSVNAFSALSSHRKPDGLFGPCLVVNRRDYYRIDGHRSVRTKILENLYMAEKFKEAGIAIACFGGKGVISYRMYPDSLSQVIDGWSKAFVSGASHTGMLLTALISLWFAGLVSVPAYLMVAALLPEIFIHPLFMSLYCLYVIEQIWSLKKIGSFYMITGVLYPLTVVFFLSVFGYSYLKQRHGDGVQWKGRTITN